MSSSFDLEDVDHFTTGAIGPPGQRVFYLQAGRSGQTVSLRLEKTQVAALATYLSAMLDDLPETGPEADPGGLPAPMDLIEPAVAEWVVGSMGVSYDEQADRIVLVAEELVTQEEPEEEGGSAGDGASARFRLTRQQVNAFTRHAAVVVAAGRPPCPLCGGPLDPEGHMCVRLNGHRRPS